MKTLEQKATELLEKLDTLATQYTPEIIDTTLDVVRISAIGDITIGIGMTIVSIWSWKKFVSSFREIAIADKKNLVVEFEVIMQCAGNGLLSFVSTLFSLNLLLDTWSWVAIFSPKLALAHRILSL